MLIPPVKQAQANGMSWYNSSWLYRKPITIDNTSGTSTLTNYQVQVSVTYDSHMQSDFDDIRFTDSDGAALIDHWRETYTTSTSATFWVEVPSIATSSTITIYMYYGNSTATSASNGDNTFDFFDDFIPNASPPSINTQYLTNWVKSADNPIITNANISGGYWPAVAYDTDQGANGPWFIFMQTNNPYVQTMKLFQGRSLNNLTKSTVHTFSQTWEAGAFEPHSLWC